MNSWPESLPQIPDQSGYSEQPVDDVLRTDTEIGPAKVRARTTATPTNLSLTMALTATQCATFDTFYRANRALSWSWKHPRTQVSATFRFRGSPKYGDPDGLYISVSFDVEVLV